VSDSDEALYARWIAGDLRAFDALHARYERPLFGFVRAHVRDQTEAEDVLHETFMAVLRERRRDIRPFFSSKAGGLGLGLPIAIKIVRLHGGELALGDHEPHGLQVTVKLPTEGPPS